MKASMGTVHFLVDRMHVSVTDRAIVKDFRNRIKQGDPVNMNRANRNNRKAIYREALKRHHGNQGLYRKVVSGRI